MLWYSHTFYTFLLTIYFHNHFWRQFSNMYQESWNYSYHLHNPWGIFSRINPPGEVSWGMMLLALCRADVKVVSRSASAPKDSRQSLRKWLRGWFVVSAKPQKWVYSRNEGRKTSAGWNPGLRGSGSRSRGGLEPHRWAKFLTCVFIGGNHKHVLWRCTCKV